MEESKESNGNPSVQISKEEEENPTINTWLDVFKIPIVNGAHFTETSHFIDISTSWGVKDAAKKEGVSFHRSFSVLKSSLIWNDGEDVIDGDSAIINATAAVPFDGKKICVSTDGSRKAILVDKKPSGDAPKAEFLQIWSSEGLLKSYDLNELDKHKSVYTSGDYAFGTMMAWSPDSKKLAYLAEKKIPKSKPFFTSDVMKDEKASDDKEKDEKDKPTRGEEYAFRQTWGEQLTDMYFSVIVVLDTETGRFEIIPLPDDEFPTDIQWLNEHSIVGLSYKIPVWRLGLMFCTNRESQIFRVDVDGKNFRFLSASGRCVRSPRVKPGGNYCIWQERALDAPHARAMAIMGLSLMDEMGNENVDNTPECIYDTLNGVPVYRDFPKNCWTPDGTTFFMLTPNDGNTKVLMISFTKDSLLPKGVPVVTEVLKDIGQAGINNILWIGEKYMLITRSSVLQIPFIELVDISEACEMENPRRLVITKRTSAITDPHKMTTELVNGESTAPSIFVGPWPKSVVPNSVPLIVMPHGGPCGVYMDTYSVDDTFFLRLGFAILKLNYIGGIGTKQDETDKLMGYAGTMDTKDCHEITMKVLKGNPSLNRDQIFVSGCSHGGFLTGHLVGSYPEFYKAAVMMNPVCDFNVMVGTSDIADWVFAEAGIPLPVTVPTARSIEEAQKFMNCSPITNVSKVLAPVLMLLGSEDLRVPMTQGLAFYRALKAMNKIAEVRIYPDNHPLYSVPVWMDSTIHIALWFKRFMK